MEASIADLRDVLTLIGTEKRKRLRALLRGAPAPKTPPVPDSQGSLFDEAS
jgi:hypothetical protein